MTAIEMLLQEPTARAIGWALLHFVWQGALVGVLAAVALRLLRQSDADVRYVVATIALAVMATLPVVTAVQSFEDANAGSSIVVSESAPVAARPLAATSVVTESVAVVPDASPAPSALVGDGAVERWMPMFVLAWMVGVAVLTLRLFSGWLWVQRMKSHGARLAGPALQASVARLSKRLHISRPVRLLESAGVDVPTVIGCIKPVILLPVSALAGLSHVQVEAILAHELAHIRRHDYLVNLLQTLLETLLFYHPAVWWLSRRIRAEREHCCDDLAVSLCGDPVAYARALADLEELRGATGRLVLAASGGPLLQRVRRLLLAGPASHDGRGPVWLAGATALLLVFGIGVSAIGATTTFDDGSQSLYDQYPPIPPAPPQPALPPSLPVPPVPMVAPAVPPPQMPIDGVVPVPPRAPVAMAVPPAPPAPMVPPVQFEPALAPPPPPPHGVPPARPAPMAPPVAPPPAAPAVPPMPPAQRQSSGNHVQWTNDGEKFEIRWNGDMEFTDDDTDVKRLSAGSQMRISDGGWLRGKSVEITADASGNITRRYWVGSNERPFEPEGKLWLAQMLPRFVRQSGIGAAGRVARFHRTQGVNGVLAEISRIEGSWAKKLYVNELLKLNISADDRRRTLEQAGREITSDYEMATLLIGNAERFFDDAGTRKAYFDAARNIKSDYEMRRVFGAALKQGTLDSSLMSALLETSRAIDSDYELASLLVQIAKQQSIEPVRAPFFAAVASLSSDYEEGRVLAAVGARTDLSDETYAAMLGSMTTMSSDHERGKLLQKVAAQGVDGALRAPFFRAVDAMRSDYERSQVLLAVARQAQLSDDTLLALLKSVKVMSSGYEASRVLQTVAAKHAVSGAARDAYIDATERLGDYEQGRALSALVKGDRARK